MKRYFFLIAFALIVSGSLMGQRPSAESIKKRFSIGFSLYNDFWQTTPPGISPRLIQQGSEVFLHYGFPMDKKNHLSFFIGAALSSHNYYHQSLLKKDANGVSYFVPEADLTDFDVEKVKKSKLSITYFDIPFGFQYKATNKIHGTLGFRAGWSINEHTKFKGTIDGNSVKDKSAVIANIESLHYGPFATIGYKWVGLTASYMIPSIFKQDLGPDLAPLSVGLVFKPF